MKIRIFYGGWILTLLATIAVVCVNKEANFWPGTVLCVGFFALSTYVLLRNKDFPFRSEALANSWIGPLIIATSEIVFSFYSHRLQTITNTEYIPSLTASILSLKQTTILSVFLIFFSACVKALFFAWIFFRYGIIHLLALIAEIPVIGNRQQRTSKDINRVGRGLSW